MPRYGFSPTCPAGPGRGYSCCCLGAPATGPMIGSRATGIACWSERKLSCPDIVDRGSLPARRPIGGGAVTGPHPDRRRDWLCYFDHTKERLRRNDVERIKK